MEIKDLLVTPIYIILLSLLAYWIRPYVTTAETRKYFLPGLWVRFLGAIMLGVIYQFYYGGGDTFSYFTHGSRWVWEAFLDEPLLGISMLFESGGERVPETFQYSQHIWYYRDPNSFFIVRLAAFFDLFTFHTYSATALFFATFSFSGLWALCSIVTLKYRHQKWLVLGILFFPSLIFWGSGILKDTITLGALGWLTWTLINLIDFRRRKPLYWMVLLASVWLIFSIKIYILMCFVPAIFFWIYWHRITNIRNKLVRVAIAPFLLLFFGLAGYASLLQIGEESSKYSLDRIAERAAITAYDIRYGWGARMSGEGGYDLGKLDGTWQSMISLMPEAINVSLFRPYLWEVRNPLMLLAALESLFLLVLTIWILFFKRRIIELFRDPFLLFCFLFALLFAFAVGVSTYNFGTLMRYKIPMIPFYFNALMAIQTRDVRDK